MNYTQQLLYTVRIVQEEYIGLIGDDSRNIYTSQQRRLLSLIAYLNDYSVL